MKPFCKNLSAIVCKNRPKWSLLLLNLIILAILTSNSESRPFFKYVAKKSEFEKIQYSPYEVPKDAHV